MKTYKQNINKFIKGLENKLTDTVMRSANETITQNAVNDKACEGIERKANAKCCPLCADHEKVVSIAYFKKYGLGGVHEACKCIIKPKFEKVKNAILQKEKITVNNKRFGILKRKMKNEKLTKLYEEYVKSDFAIEKARAYLREAEKAGDIKYLKPLDDFRARDERDLFAHVALHHVGVKFVVRKENAPRGFANVDLKIWGRLWELKSPTAKPKADGRIRFVNSNIAKANKQFKNHYPVPIKNYRIIFSNRYTEFDDETIISEVEKEVKKLNVKECLYINKKGNVIKIV